MEFQPHGLGVHPQWLPKWPNSTLLEDLGVEYLFEVSSFKAFFDFALTNFALSLCATYYTSSYTSLSYS